MKTILGSVKVKSESSASKVVAGIRPEGFVVGKDANSFSCKVSLMENLGSEFAVYFTIGDTDLVTVVSRTDTQAFGAAMFASVDISVKTRSRKLCSMQIQARESVKEFHMYDIKLQGITKKFEAFTAVNDINFTIPKSSVTVLLGPSKRGKTTLMRMIAGLESPTEGRILFDEHDVTDALT